MPRRGASAGPIMPLSNAAFQRSVASLLLVGLLTLLVIVGITLWLTVRTESYSAEVARGRQVRSQLVGLRSLLQDAETGQRGFLLTADPAYLAPYEAGRTGMAAALEGIRSFARTGYETTSIDRLEGITKAKLDELAETIELARSGRSDEALAIVRTDRGKRLMDDARTSFGELLTVVDARIGDRMDAQNTSIAALKWSVLLGSVLIVLVVGGSVLIAAHYTRDIAAARLALSDLNAGLEQRVEDRTAALSRANDEIQRFAYVVSHDLRSPLVNVIGFAGELEALRTDIFARLAQARQAAGSGPDEADLQLAADFDEALGFVRSSVTKMDGLIASILKLAREGGRILAPESLDMTALLQQVAADVRHRVDEMSGNVVVKGAMPMIISDRLALEQIFGNLVDNAVKYRAPERAPEIVLEGRARGAHVEFSVRDNGRGIAPADRERVFELFRRAGPQTTRGEGIGLAHVRALARRLGGEITLVSELGRGSTFLVQLPQDIRTAAV